jgi:microcystin-dependent protein
MPAHSHPFQAATDIGTTSNPNNNRLAQSDTLKMYSTVAPASALGPESILPTGGSQPHPNFQPYLCINFIIALFGLFPTQN